MTDHWPRIRLVIVPGASVGYPRGVGVVGEEIAELFTSHHLTANVDRILMVMRGW